MSTPKETVYQIELDLLARVRHRRFEPDSAVVPDLIAGRLFERLSLLKSEPKRVLDLGAGDGRRIPELRALFPEAAVFGGDVSHVLLEHARSGPFWRRKPPLICLDAEQLPFADGSMDLVVSNLMLPWIHPPDTFAAELQRILSASGAFFFSTAGPDTLIELRSAWSEIDSSAHINMLLDMHDIGDVLLRTGIADPVIDTERLQINYPSLDSLLDEMVANGALNVLSGRRKSLIGSDIRKRLASHYPVNSEGGVTATLEVVYAHGWKGQPKAAHVPGEFYISPEVLRRRKN